MKYHVRKNPEGKWVEENGREIPEGASIVYHYGGVSDITPVKGIPCIRPDKPHHSEAGAIHVLQVDSFNENCARGTHYDQDTGRLVSTSSAAREREARRRGLSFN